MLLIFCNDSCGAGNIYHKFVLAKVLKTAVLNSLLRPHFSNY